MNKKLFIHPVPQNVLGRCSVEDKRAELFKCAKELFSQKGFKDTNVADITKAAGIGVGTFYNYYPSKEKLFMEIYMEENGRLSKELLESIDVSQEPIALIKQLLILNMEKMLANPILCQWYNRDVFGKIEKLFRDEKGLEANDFMYQTFYVLVQKWQAEGKMRSDIDCGMIMAIFGAIIKIGFYKEEIGLKYFPDLQDYLTEFVLKGLTDCRSAGGGGKAPA
jgi:AcrR family transcriptional regulator